MELIFYARAIFCEATYVPLYVMLALQLWPLLEILIDTDIRGLAQACGNSTWLEMALTQSYSKSSTYWPNVLPYKISKMVKCV